MGCGFMIVFVFVCGVVFESVINVVMVNIVC